MDKKKKRSKNNPSYKMPIVNGTEIVFWMLIQGRAASKID